MRDKHKQAENYRLSRMQSITCPNCEESFKAEDGPHCPYCGKNVRRPF